MAGDRRIGFAAVAVFLGLVLRFWHPVYGFTAFLQFDAAGGRPKIAAWRDLPIYAYPGAAGYDGAFYAQIAYHPLLRSPDLGPATDNLAYRARRILPSALAWLLAAGRPAAIASVYSLLEVAAWLALAPILWRLLAVGSGRSWLAWLGVLFSAGALASVRLALPDLLAVTLIAAAMLARERKCRGAAGWLAAAGLARETSLLALGGICTLGGRRGEAGQNLRRVLLAVLPLALWLVYIRLAVGPADQGWDKFTWPLAAFVGKWRASLADVRSPTDFALAWTTLLALAGLTIQAAYLAIRPDMKDPWWRLGAAYVVLLLFLGASIWEGHPGAAARVLLPMTLAFNVLASRRGAALAWLLLGNLTVPAGLLAMIEVPVDAREVAALRAHGIASVARADGGWYNVEHSLRHSWVWTEGGGGALAVESWPRVTRILELEFSTRSLTPRTLEVREGDAVLWRGAIGPDYRVVSLRFAVTRGRAELAFASDAAAVATGEGPSARPLAFNLRDVRITAPKTSQSPPASAGTGPR